MLTTEKNCTGQENVCVPGGPKGKKKALAKGQSPPQELEEGPRSRPHLLVSGNTRAPQIRNEILIGTDIKKSFQPF